MHCEAQFFYGKVLNSIEQKSAMQILPCCDLAFIQRGKQKGTCQIGGKVGVWVAKAGDELLRREMGG
jgi:hypothetical protein